MCYAAKIRLLIIYLSFMLFHVFHLPNGATANLGLRCFGTATFTNGK